MSAPRILHLLLCAIGVHDWVFFHRDQGAPTVRWFKCLHCGKFNAEVSR